MDILGQSSLLVAVASFSLAVTVLARDIRNKLFLAYSVLCILISVWAFAFFLEKVFGPDNAAGFYRIHLLMNIWLAPAGIAFIRVLTRVRDRASRVLFDASLFAAIALTAALVSGFGDLPIVREVILLSPALVAAQTVHLILIDRRLRGGMKREPKAPTVGIPPGRRFWIYAGGLCVLALSVMDHFPWLGTVLPSIGNLGLAVYLFFLSQAISHQRLLNFSALMSRVMVLLAVAFTLTGVYSLLFAWIQDRPGLFFLNSFIVALLVLMLLDPLRALVGYATQRLLSKDHRRLQQILSEARGALAGVVDADRLFQRIFLTVEQIFQPQHVALYVLRGDGTRFMRVRHGMRDIGREISGKGEGFPVRELLSDNPLVRQMLSLKAKGELPVLLEQVLESEIDRSASRAQRQALSALIDLLKALEANLLIPLIEPQDAPASGRVLGFVALLAPNPPDSWGNNWGLLHAVYPYFEQASRTLRSMEVYRGLREKERLAALGEMAAGLAHEIRNPLGAIKGAAQFLDPNADRPDSRFLRVIIEEVDRLNRVVTQFLEYSKPQQALAETVDVASIARKTLDLLRPSVAAGVRLEFLGPTASQELRIRGSGHQIHQLILNLVQNSLNALAGRETGEVRVSVRPSHSQVRDEEGSVVLEVEDNGPGIQEEHLDKLFIPFFTTSPSGTGLGLSICQKIVEGHGGRIEVDSKRDQYTRFTVTFPALKASVRRDSPPAEVPAR